MESSEASTISSLLQGNRALELGVDPTTSIHTDVNEQKYREAFAKACRCIGPHLRLFEEELAKQLVSDNPQIDRVLKYVSRLGGKRLRPATVRRVKAGRIVEWVTMFILVRQVQMPKLLDGRGPADAWASRLPDQVVKEWEARDPASRNGQ